MTKAALIPYPLGTDFIDTNGHVEDMAWAIDPRLIQQHTTLADAEAMNSSSKAVRRRGQIVYLTSTREYYTWVGTGVTVNGVAADSKGWIPLARLVFASKSAWESVNDLMPRLLVSSNLNTNLSSTKGITLYQKSLTMPAHPTVVGGWWDIAMWATVRLAYNSGQYRVVGYIDNKPVFYETFHIGPEASGRKSHTCPVGIGRGYRSGATVTLKINAEVLQATGGKTMNVDYAPSLVEAMTWPRM